jgi:hypothetical protein
MDELDIVQAFQRARQSLAKETRQASVAQHCAERVRRAVQAHCSVEKKNLSEAMLKAVRDIAVQYFDEFVDVSLLTAPEIVAEAIEDADIEQQRQELQAEAATMRSVLDEIKGHLIADTDMEASLSLEKVAPAADQ